MLRITEFAMEKVKNKKNSVLRSKTQIRVTIKKRIAALFGGSDKYREALRELEKELYRVA